MAPTSWHSPPSPWNTLPNQPSAVPLKGQVPAEVPLPEVAFLTLV